MKYAAINPQNPESPQNNMNIKKQRKQTKRAAKKPTVTKPAPTERVMWANSPDEFLWGMTLYRDKASADYLSDPSKSRQVLVLPWSEADRERVVEVMARAAYHASFPASLFLWEKYPYKQSYINDARAALAALAAPQGGAK